MTWIVRQGTDKGQGLYLWETSSTTFDWTLAAGGLHTAMGGQWWQHAPVLVPAWEASQAGAWLYTNRREAVRVAKKVGGRVVVLLPSATKDGG